MSDMDGAMSLTENGTEETSSTPDWEPSPETEENASSEGFEDVYLGPEEQPDWTDPLADAEGETDVQAGSEESADPRGLDPWARQALELRSEEAWARKDAQYGQGAEETTAETPETTTDLGLDPWARKALQSPERPPQQEAGSGTSMPHPDKMVVTSGYGKVRIVDGVKTPPHKGVDLENSYGDPVLAAKGGKVVKVGPDSHGVGGNMVIIQVDPRTQVSYAHLGSKLQVGESVSPGQEIGQTDDSGKQTGPHIHFAVTQDGQHIDPLKWLDENQAQHPRSQRIKYPR